MRRRVFPQSSGVRPWRWAVLAAVLALCALLGCSTSSGPQAPNEMWMSAVPAAQFFKYGPAQAFGADFNLIQGQRVKMLKREFGFSQVMLANGQTGYVATEDLKLAPPEPPAPRTASSSALFPARGNATAAGAPGKKKRSSAPWSRPQPEPKLDLSDVPAPPLPQDPEPSPASPPKMRY